ncbi:MAG: TetR/AcrR family transcriptional regulator [Acidimicrobiia bacterium]|nr:TetR/AcrR family transcriptional regulator [Acidimicrobiia bacterium]
MSKGYGGRLVVEIEEPDGRNLRRATNRQAVLDALVELFGEGRYQPSTAEIAERAGISPRSLFRYFDDLDDLVRAAIEQSLAAARPLFDHDIDPAAPTGQKIAAFVAARSRLFEAIGPSARAGRASAHRHPALARQIHDGRSYLRRELRRTFAPELAGRPAGLLPALDALTQFESYELLRHDQRLSARRATDAVALAMTTLLAP